MTQTARIVHLAVKVEDVEKAAAFYEGVFGFKRSEVTRKRGHVSCHLTDGRFDLALIQYDSEDTVEADWAGPGPRIHHVGLAVADTEQVSARLAAHRCQVLSKPGVLPVKYRSPDGIVGEIGPYQIYPGVPEK